MQTGYSGHYAEFLAHVRLPGLAMDLAGSGVSVIVAAGGGFVHLKNFPAAVAILGDEWTPPG